jgi:hypothetical protein
MVRDLTSSEVTSQGFETRRLAVVWGNCQAAPIAELIAEPLATAGIEVVRTPPVFEIDETTLELLRSAVLPRAAVLISQPIRDEYRLPGCGTRQLAELLPPDAQLLTFPVVYDSSAFPFQARGHSGDGERIAAPLTDYHDLRAIVAAERQLSVEQALKWWPAPTAEMVTANADRSIAELRQREQTLDVPVAGLLHCPTPPMHTLTHPTNSTLSGIARRILAALGVVDGADIETPTREFLGAIRTPVEPAVAAALGYSPQSCHSEWIIDKRPVPLAQILEVQLSFYAQHPDVVSDARSRFADRLALLEL